VKGGVLGWGVICTLALSACEPAERVATEPPPVDSIPVTTASVERVDTLVTGLEIPWGIARLPDGRWLVTERPGRLLLFAADWKGEARTLLTLDVHASDPNWHPESGLMGIALSPDFAASGHVFVVGTFPRDDRPAASGVLTRLWRRVAPAKPSTDALPFENRILRLTLRGDSVEEQRVLVRGLYTNHYHAGGALAIGPDRKLYTTLGDGRTPGLAARLDNPAGKVLRFELDGSIPSDNPHPDSPIWASGFRNTQALAWLPDGTLLGVDHGPSGLPDEAGRTGLDELNVIVSGADYGWPTHQVGARGSRAPLRRWESAVAPAGLTIEYTSTDGDSAWVLVGHLRGGVERITLVRHGGRWLAVSATHLAAPALRRLRGLWMREGGILYGTTSNRDIRGVALDFDDLIIRIRLADAPDASPAP
jgi:aldose sugar dehydrogenase